MNAVCFRILWRLGLTYVMAGSNLCLSQSWTQTSAHITNWTCVASSADGGKLVAAVNGGFIYTSTNSGLSWTQTSAPTNSWTSLACSADGTRLFAACSAWEDLPVYSSSNSGATWEVTASDLADRVVCSADGMKVATADLGQVAVSTNSAANWTTLGPNGSSVDQFLGSISSSADGDTLAVVETAHLGPPSQLLTTPSSAWIADYLTPPPNVLYTAVAMSADGTRLAATINNYGYMVVPPTTNCSGTLGMLYTSSKSGTDEIITCTPLTNWSSIASSADGNRLVAVAGDGAIYTSTDAGANWQPANVTNANWSGVASSADGCKLVAVANGGGIYTSQTAAVPALNITQTGNALLISWIIPSTGFLLQQSSSLNSTRWTDTSVPVVLNLTNLQDQVNLSAPTAPTFYRLRTFSR